MISDKKTIFFHDVLESTQIEAKRLAKEGAPEGTVVVAGEQTKGYGRQGAFWHSAPGGLWFSVILYPKGTPDQIEKFSLLAGESIKKTLETLYPEVYFEVKPPNDILVRFNDGTKKKVCGILCESQVEGDFLKWLILGIGLNVSNKLPEELGSQATTLAELVDGPPKSAVLLKLLTRNLFRDLREGFF